MAGPLLITPSPAVERVARMIAADLLTRQLRLTPVAEAIRDGLSPAHRKAWTTMEPAFMRALAPGRIRRRIATCCCRREGSAWQKRPGR
jgi:hypothetical protein